MLSRRSLLSVLGALTVLAVGLFALAIATGPIPLRLGAGASRLAWELRAARALMALLLGCGLSVSGSLLQGALRNDLVEPGILGVHSGGNLAAALVSLLLPAVGLALPALLAGSAWIGSLGSCLLVYVLARTPGGPKPTQLLLTGVAVGAVLSAATVAVGAFSDFQHFHGVVVRQLGSLSSADLPQVATLAPFVLVLALAAWLLARPTNVLGLGDEPASSLGLDTGQTRLAALAIAAGLSGACTAVGGGIAFVGLLAPHVGRRLVGPDQRRLLPVAALVGGLLVMAADVLARTILQPNELPAGLFVGVLGAPYLLYLLMRS